MRSFLALAFSAFLFPAAAFAQVTMGSDVYVVGGANLPALEMAAWNESGEVKTATRAATADAPSNAVKYTAKQVIWPTGRVRIMNFDESHGGVLHPITDETLLYVLSGSAEVGVGGKTASLLAGDVVSFPSGALRNPGGKPSSASIVTWNVDR
jgi:quercetin dioxygenase-like cupin family protein